MTIVPMRDLKDTVKIENLCLETKAPVFITKNGYGKLVVMDIELFEKILKDAFEAKMVNAGLEQVKNDELFDGNNVLNEMKRKYGL